ncbi:TadE/TadG family type IV pilus assembly protein [Cellulomonas fengjieae]|uniref:Pilus assembly protein n=1 Tax=Cellulomonas fengjieae TaxID=2819978 RepID=A0ABS3SIE2_9CELL|nr:TadE/TadG family type IV pilus assembly protein [Cellulomonas fengjieae]MBO3085518.1 pilus assembly protein [Cellulomonas fengjieae]MBO3102626.1 pilus assembly protein [Cellulomonas fengjieae]QVI64439.1 pilus assembly protein [Cellulomonas fengjieae]
MAVEIVVLVPMLVLVMVLIVAFGRYVTTEGDAQAAAREAVRAASLQRDEPSALAAAQSAAQASTPDSLVCAPAELRGAFVAGGTVTVELACTVSWSNLGLIGLTGTADVTASSSAPLDLYRRTGAP